MIPILLKFIILRQNIPTGFRINAIENEQDEKMVATDRNRLYLL